MIIGSYGSLAGKLFDEEKIYEGHFRELLAEIGIDMNEIYEDDAD